ncbi:oligosaccharide flippase family protein, partial [Candidatus Pelagibacter bacterium]|nr:oligosaccharide flippase family protein [Candidatus Pelagibacter bacterium]
MKGTLSFASASFAERLVSFFLLPILTKLVTPEEYAIWTQSIIIAGILMPVILLKFETSVVKFFPNWNNQNKKQNSIILFMLTLVLLLFCLFAIISFIFNEKIAYIIFGDYQKSLYIPLIIFLLLSELLFEFFIALLRISNRIGKISIYILMKGVWRLGILILVLIGIKGSFYYALGSFVIFQLFITLGLYIWEVNLFSLVKAGLKIGRPNWEKVLKFSLPLVPFIILMMIHNFIDRFLITHFLGLKSLAIYSAGFSIAVVITFFHSTISFMLYPELSRKWASKNKTKIKYLMKKVVTAYLALTIPFLVFVGIAGNDVLLALTTSDYLISNQTLFLLSLNMGIFGLFQFAHYIVILDRGTLNAPILMTFITGINILLNLLLIPKIGILGAALSGFFSTFTLALIVYYMSQKNLKWNFPLIESVKILLRSLIMGVVIWQGMTWLGNDIISLAIIIIISGLLYVLLDYFGDKDSSFISLTELKSDYKKINFRRKFKKILETLIGRTLDSFIWEYRSFFIRDWRHGYIDLHDKFYPHRELLTEKIIQQNSTKSILEIGCADGINLRILQKKIPGVTCEGIDINKKALNYGMDIIKKKNIKNIKLKYNNAKDLKSYEDKKFDIVFCHAVLMYVDINDVE